MFKKLFVGDIHVPVPKRVKKLFVGNIHVPVPKRFQPKEMVFYQWIPNQDATYKKLDGLIEAFHSLYDDSLVHGMMNGQLTVSLELYSENKTTRYIVGFPKDHHIYLSERLRYTYKGSGIAPVERLPLLKEEDEAVSMASVILKHHGFKALNMKVEGDFIESLLSAHDLIEEDEVLWTQILIQPASNYETQAYLEEKYNMYLNGDEVMAGVGLSQLVGKGLKSVADTPRKVLENYVEQPTVAPPNKVQKLHATEKKITQNQFRVVIRIATKVSSKYRNNFLLNSAGNAFRTLNADNQLILKTKSATANRIYQMNNRHFQSNAGVLSLCHDEVKIFFQTPTKDMESETLEVMMPEEHGIDKRLTKEGIHIAYAPHDEKIKVRIPVKDIDDGAKVRAWIASPGGGKSTQIEAFSEGAAELGHGFAIYDGKDGVMFHRTLSTLSARHNEERFEIIDYENDVHPPIFNFDALGSEGQSAGSMFVELFQLLFSGKDLITSKSFAVKAAQSVFSDPLSTFLEFIQMIRDNEFRNKFVPKLRKINPDMYLWWKQDFPKISDNELNRMIRPILDRMENDILYNDKMSSILCGRGGSIQYYKWMQEGKLVFVNAPLGHFTEPELQFIMALHSFASWNATLARRKITQSGKRARLFHLVYDEPQNYMDATPTIQVAIAKARAYSVSYNFFIQEAEQIIEKRPALWKTIMGMSPMLMVGPISQNTATLLSKELGVSVDDILRIKQLPYHWWYKGYANKAAVPSQIVKAVTPIDLRNPPIPLTDRSKLKERMALKYGPMSKKQIQEDISARNFKLTVPQYRQLLASYEKDDMSEEGVEWED